MPRSRRIRRSLSNLTATLGFVLGVPALVGFALFSEQGGAGSGGAGAGAGAGASGGTGGAGAGAAGSGAGAGSGSADDDDEDELGPAGVQAYERTKEKLRSVKSERQQLREELERLQNERKTDEERARDTARSEGKEAAEKDLTPKLSRLTIENAILRHVGSKFADPDDAVLNLLDADVIDDDGDVDVKKLKKSADELLERKPHLAAGTSTSTSAGTNGSRSGGSPRPRQGASDAGTGGPDPDFAQRMKENIKQRTGIS